MIGRESDQPIVLGDGRADHGKGLTEVRSWQRKHCPARRAGFSNANLTAGNSNYGDGRTFLFRRPDTEASIFEEPGAKNRHAGIRAGAVRATGRPTAMPDIRESCIPLRGKIRDGAIKLILEDRREDGLCGIPRTILM